MSDTPRLSRRTLFKGLGIGGGIGALAGFGVGALLKNEKLCLSENLPDDAPATSHALRRLIATFNDFDQDYLKGQFGDANANEVAEGERYLLHLISTGIELFVEGRDTHPEFASIVSPTRKLMGDNADAYYFHTQIRGDHWYRIRGQRNGEVYLSFTIHTADEPGGWATGVASDINHEKIQFDDKGNFEILVGPEDKGNGFYTTPKSVSIISRHYFMEEHYAAADPMLYPRLTIEPIEPVAPPPPITDADMAAKIDSLNAFIRANSIERPMFNPLTVPDWFSIIPNSLGKPAKWTNEEGGGGWGAVDNAYSAGLFKLKADEALIIRGTMPGCIFSNVILWNRFLQSFDYRYRQVSLNKRQMKLDAQGNFTLVVAHTDPGVDNWLDTEGHESGIVYWRFMLPEDDIAPIETEKVKLSELAESLG